MESAQFKLKDCIKGLAKLTHYRDEELWYQCENGLQFPVHTDDCGDTMFLSEEKAIHLMKWIRKYLNEMWAVDEARKLDKEVARCKAQCTQERIEAAKKLPDAVNVIGSKLFSRS